MSAPGSKRVVLIGLDAAEPLVLEEEMRAGRLPQIASFAAAGRGVLLAPPDAGFPGASWPTFNTGVRMATHRVLRDRRLAAGSYRIEDVPAGRGAAPPFWRHVSDHGLRSTVSNLYSAPLLDGFRGTQLQGWASMDPYVSKFGVPLVDPPGTLEWLEGEAGRPALAYEGRALATNEDVRRYRDARLADIRTRTKGYRLLLDRDDWSLFYVSYPEIHHAGHLLWHLHDPTHPDHDPAAPEDCRDALRALYRGLDEAVGTLRSGLPADVPVFVVSPHGMGQNLLVGEPGDELLRRAGWLATGGLAEDGRPLRTRAVSAVWQAARKVVPEQARLALRRRVADRQWLEAMALADVDWPATKAFTVPPDTGSYIRLNVRGREPAGTVEPGAEYDAVVRAIAAAFSELTLDPGGEPAVERILFPDDILGPEAPDGMPDLVVLWTRERRVERVRSERFGAIDVPRTDVRTGQHRPLGYVVGVAPWLPASGEPSFGEVEGTLLDLAPTVLSVLGVPLPPSLEGSPLASLVPPAA